MSDQFVAFHSFTDIELAKDLAQILEANDIPVKIEKPPSMLDSQIIGTSSNPDIFLKIHPSDFPNANKFLEDHYQRELNNIDPEYYLFSFTTTELFDIIQKPDEWSPLDYQLAKKLLAERGERVDPELLQKLKSDRKEILAQPEKADLILYVLAWLFVLTGMLYLASPVLDTYQLSFCSTLFSVFIGRHISRNSRVLPDGQTIFAYNPVDRKRGKNIMSLALAVFGACVVKYLWVSFMISNS